MDTLAQHFVAGSKVLALFAYSSPDLRMRRKRSYIVSLLPAQSFAAGNAVIVHRRPIAPLSCSSTEMQVDELASAVETPELTPASQDTPFETIEDTKIVHVKFILQKKCAYGQQFYLVGNDPICGLWDPSKAVPLQWSDGHSWTAELDIPVEKELQYKFIRKGPSGDIKWQQGRDRSLKPWETTRTIVVTDEWHKPEHQKLAEEEENLVVAVEEMNMGGVTGEAMIQKEIPEADKNLAAAEMNSKSKIDEEKLIGEGGVAIAASETASESSQKMLAAGEAAEVSSDEVAHFKSSQSSEEKDDVSGGPNGRSLVEEEITNAYQKSNDGEGCEEVHIRDGGALAEDKILVEEPSSKSANYILQKDLQWGLQALKHLLTTLGFNPSLYSKLFDK